MSWSALIPLKKHSTLNVVILSKQILSRRCSCPISVSVLAGLVSDSSTMRNDCLVAWGIVKSGSFGFRLPVLSRALCSWRVRNANLFLQRDKGLCWHQHPYSFVAGVTNKNSVSEGAQRSWHIPSAFDTIAVAYATSTDLMYVLNSSK